MKRKKERIAAIREIIASGAIGNQQALLDLLAKRGFRFTQATLSRDLKLMQIAKISTPDGDYQYVLPEDQRYLNPRLDEEADGKPESFGRLWVEANENVAIVHTAPGRASGVAYAIDSAHLPDLLGTIAGDDTVAVFPRIGISATTLTAVIRTLFGIG